MTVKKVVVSIPITVGVDNTIIDLHEKISGALLRLCLEAKITKQITDFKRLVVPFIRLGLLTSNDYQNMVSLDSAAAAIRQYYESRARRDKLRNTQEYNRDMDRYVTSAVEKEIDENRKSCMKLTDEQLADIIDKGSLAYASLKRAYKDLKKEPFKSSIKREVSGNKTGLPDSKKSKEKSYNELERLKNEQTAAPAAA